MFGAELDGIEVAVEKLIASEHTHDLARLHRCVERLQAAFVREVGRADRDGRLAELHRTPAGSLADGCRLSFGAARRMLDDARRLQELPETLGAFLDGTITDEHARVIAAAYTPARAEVLVDLEPDLVDAARRFTARQLRCVVRRVTDAIDGDGGGAAANDDFERRNLHVLPTSWGLAPLRGDLAPETAELLCSALEARMADDPDAAGDPRRTRGQRREDALRDIMRFFLDHRDGREPARRRAAFHAGVHVDLDVLRRDGHVDLADAVRGDLLHVGAVSAETLRRLVCDGVVHRVITQGRSEVLDLGRATRVVSRAQWNALVARDGGCTHPGCTAPPGWCEAHHVLHWADGGATDLANLRLLCWRHHRDEHEGHCRRRAG